MTTKHTFVVVLEVTDDAGRDSEELKGELPYVIDRTAGTLTLESTVYSRISDFEADLEDGVVEIP